MSPLAHLTVPDLGLIVALLLSTALLAAAGARWLERRRG